MNLTGIVVRVVEVTTIPESSWPTLFAVLDETERRQAARFAFDRHRREYVAAHALKRLLLSLSVTHNVQPQAWRFKLGATSKPQVQTEHQSAPHFNLSHCDGLVACALSHVVAVGVDVERLTPTLPTAIAAQYFAPTEVRWFEHQPTQLRAQAFLRLWTLKEAYIKATGLGLAQSLQEFAFQFEPLRIEFSATDLGDARRWRFEQHYIGDQHVMGLAWQDGPECQADIAAAQLDTLLSEAGCD